MALRAGLSRLRIVLGRLGGTLLLLVAVSFATFTLLDLTRGDAAVALVQARAQPLTEERLDAAREELGLNRPFLARYQQYMADAVRGDFGVSARTGNQVAAEVGPRLGPTLLLLAAGSLVMLALALTVGVGEVLLGRGLSFPLRLTTLALISVPSFALAFLLVSWLALGLRLLPTQGTEGLRSLVLPALVLGLPAGAALARVLSSRIREALAEPFAVMAIASGYSNTRCVLGWALPNAGVTSIVVAGNIIADIAAGTIVVELLFGWPGLGRYLLDAVRFRDFDALCASVLIMAVLIIGIRALSLALAGWLDPRAARTEA